MQFKAEVKVTLKEAVLDPQGSAVEASVKAMGFGQVAHVRIGKLIQFFVEAESQAEAEGMVEAMAGRLLANPVMERFTYTVAPAAGVR
ncbi:MAG: phosphoribosylformylglycinamidine synthase subunit PurS [Mycobacterium leprae]